jgi:replication factor C subunit 3/5
MDEDIPWVEKYRPSNISSIILSDENTKIVASVFQQNYIPNILFYGPPGTGKTTTVIQIIKEYQEVHNEAKQGLMIHLNASDERGVEVIRSQINAFVTSKTFFGKGLKFVVLDEVDYMTKNAQQALTYVLQEHNAQIRFFLICNYISKIDETLQSYFMKMNFNHLPKEKMVVFLMDIARKESLELSTEQAKNVCDLYNSDVRSMINYLQLNKTGNQSQDILNVAVWDGLYGMVVNRENINNITSAVQRIAATFNTDQLSVVKDFLNYAILKYDSFPTAKLAVFANALHGNATPSIMVAYVFLKLLAYTDFEVTT